MGIAGTAVFLSENARIGPALDDPSNRLLGTAGGPAVDNNDLPLEFAFLRENGAQSLFQTGFLVVDGNDECHAFVDRIVGGIPGRHEVNCPPSGLATAHEPVIGDISRRTFGARRARRRTRR